MMSNVQAQEYFTQGSMLDLQGNYEEALEYYNKALAEDSMNLDAYIAKGAVLANLERLDEAEKQFQNALKVNRTSALAYFHLGNVALMKEDMAQGFENYNKAIANGFDDAQIYYNIGLMHEEMNEPDLAIRSYTKAISKDALRPDIRLRKAELLIQNDSMPEALQALDELILSNPDVFEGYHTKFTVLMHMGRLDEADELLKGAIELFPDDIDFIIDRSSLLIEQGKTNEAIKLLEDIEKDAVGDDATQYKVFMERARIYAAKQDVDKAIKELEGAKAVAVKNDDYDTESQFLLMNCYVAKGEFQKVLDYSRELIEKAEEGDYYLATAKYYEPFALKNLGKTQEARELYEQAIDELRSICLENPGNLETYLLRALCHTDIEEYDNALDLVDYIIKLKPEVPEPRFQKIAILEAMGKTDEAAEEKKTVNAMLPPDMRMS